MTTRTASEQTRDPCNRGLAPSARTASAQITEEVTAWPGVSAGPGDRGSFSFKLGRRELGHLHGDRVLHLGLPKAVWHELHDAGRIDYHPVFPAAPSARAGSATPRTSATRSRSCASTTTA
jgi:Family of unknown function (DUF5519)